MPTQLFHLVRFIHLGNFYFGVPFGLGGVPRGLGPLEIGGAEPRAAAPLAALSHYSASHLSLSIGGGAYEARRLVPPRNLGPMGTLWSVPPQNFCL